MTTASAMNSVKLNTDIVFVANQFTFDKLYFTSDTTQKRNPFSSLTLLRMFSRPAIRQRR